MESLFQTIVENVTAPLVDPDGSFQLQVSALDYSTYVGVIGIGRIQRGRFSRNDVVCVAGRRGQSAKHEFCRFGFQGLDRVELDGASAGDIVAFTVLMVCVFPTHCVIHRVLTRFQRLMLMNPR
ncbi:MAG: hypothetical protein Ct9H300mP14_12450 [Gammaproteobacteria bacterium]|nr:MAG: hypothetical protein Ct9H300mP14_12450 [Gammaproteobacteria bacterium]